MRILHLTLKKKWFNLIASGEKNIEYRELKPYWIRRLFKDGCARQFDEVHFRNGYGVTAPFMRVQWVGMSVTSPDRWIPAHDEDIWEDTIMIHLGTILELKYK
jgi:hypothetical protein